jgi:thiamine-monophosphate kinase
MKLSEFELIESIKKKFPCGDKNIILGIGDDACILRSSNESFVITTDSLVEGVHFKWNLTEPEDAGWKSLAVNLSDIAAMGCRPLYFLLSLFIPRRCTDSLVSGVIDGIYSCAKHYNVSLLGGNISSIEKHFVISITLIGETVNNRFLRRSGAKNGDLLYICGDTGLAHAGLEVLSSEKKNFSATFPSLVRAYRKPFPLTEQGLLISQSGLASSMIDISDGLAQDLSHMLEDSQFGADIFLDKIELHEELIRFCSKFKKDPNISILGGGEDYSLLFTVPPENRKRFSELLSRIKACQIGKITGLHKGVEIFSKGRKIRYKGTQGFRHF